MKDLSYFAVSTVFLCALSSLMVSTSPKEKTLSRVVEARNLKNYALGSAITVDTTQGKFKYYLGTVNTEFKTVPINEGLRSATYERGVVLLCKSLQAGSGSLLHYIEYDTETSKSIIHMYVSLKTTNDKGLVVLGITTTSAPIVNNGVLEIG